MVVIPNFVSPALHGEPVTVYGDRTPLRCFAHVKDVVHPLVELMNRPAALGKVFSVGSNEKISIGKPVVRVLQNRDRILRSLMYRAKRHFPAASRTWSCVYVTRYGSVI